MEPVDMLPENSGIWMFHCHLGGHVDAGMVTLYKIELQSEVRMSAIVKRSVFAARQSPMAEITELAGTAWQCPVPHTPIAGLGLVVGWRQESTRKSDRGRNGSKTTALASFAVVLAVLLAFAGTAVAAIYFSGMLLQRVQHLQRYNEPRARYSDVWKWQGQR